MLDKILGCVMMEDDSLIDESVRMPNGEIMSLHSLSQGIVLYGIAKDGDEFIRAPLFSTPGDAILRSLEVIFIPDTLDMSEKEPIMRSIFNLHEYVVSNDGAMYYDSREKVRPGCGNAIGEANFKIDYVLRLPDGDLQYDDVDRAGDVEKSRGQAVNDILGVIRENSNVADLRNTGTWEGLAIEAFTTCTPSSVLTVTKSFKIEMSVLWAFYAGLLSAGLSPNDIRNTAFSTDARSQAVIDSLVRQRIMPRSRTMTEDKESLWETDVMPIHKIYLFVDSDSSNSLSALDSIIPVALNENVRTYNTNSWFFHDDFNPEMEGKTEMETGENAEGSMWNHNRFLDINTTMYFFLLNLFRSKVLTNLTPVTEYDVNKHLESIRKGGKYRFSERDDEVIYNLRGVKIFDSVGDIEVTFSINLVDDGLNINIRNIAAVTSNQTRAKITINIIEDDIRKIVSRINSSFKTSFKLSRGYGPNFWILEFADRTAVVTTATGSVLPANYFLLVVMNTILRYLVVLQDFSYFSWRK